MHRCRSINNGLYPTCSCSCSHSIPVPVQPIYEYIEPLPLCESHYCDYSPPRRHARCAHEYAPVVQTHIHNDFCHHFDEPDEFYDDEYGNTYRLSRSKVQLVDLPARNRQQRPSKPMVISTFQSNDQQQGERVMYPRSQVVRNTSVPIYERKRPVKLMPLYHSAEPRLLVSHRKRPAVRELIPVATMADSYPRHQTIRVRSLSPLD